ncbi:MAG: hypothetical protein GY714_02490 [Desulfobacterales bacterium]|nr:hypothetical protein [Desulfobacterales bacterium]
MYIDINTNFIESANAFKKCISMFGGNYNEWYVGLTNNPKHSFLNIHQIDVMEQNWILSNPCSTVVILYARKLLISMGCINNRELDMKNSDRVYLYKMSKESRK